VVLPIPLTPVLPAPSCCRPLPHTHPPAGNDATEAYATAFAQAAAAGGDQAEGLVQAVAAVSCEGGARAQAFAEVGGVPAVDACLLGQITCTAS
jgi:hypothetical protein